MFKPNPQIVKENKFIHVTDWETTQQFSHSLEILFEVLVLGRNGNFTFCASI